MLCTYNEMGGGQIYTRNKALYLRSKGWNVSLYTARSGKLYLNEINDFKHDVIPELESIPFIIPAEKVNHIIDYILENNYDSDTIIESCKDVNAIWGELIAKKCSGKHVFFCLDEEFPKYHKWFTKFLRFKIKRHELVGIEKKSISMMKPEKSIDEIWKCQDHLDFLCNNYIDKEGKKISLKDTNFDIKFGCISRLNKSYIIPMVKQLSTFAKNHLDKRICLYIVGGSNKDDALKCKINNVATQANNLRIIFLGAMSPIPQKIIDIVDYFIGTAGSATMTAMAGKITIAVDTRDASPLGIRFYDLRGISTGPYKNEGAFFPYKDLSQYIEHIVFDTNKELLEEDIRKYAQEMRPKFDFMIAFDKHMDYIEQSVKEKDFFEFHIPYIQKLMYKIKYHIKYDVNDNNLEKIKYIKNRFFSVI